MKKKMSSSVSKVASFKHEDEAHGMAVGPVIVTATEPYDAWVKRVTKLVAKEIATHYGVALKEF